MDPTQPAPNGPGILRRCRQLCTSRNAHRLLAGLLWLAIFIGAYHFIPILPKATLHHDERIHQKAISPDGKHLVTIGPPVDAQGEITTSNSYLWDLESGLLISKAQPAGYLGSEPFSPRGEFFVETSMRGWILRSAATGQILADVPMPNFNLAPRFSPDGSCVIYQEWGKISFWDIQSKQVRWSIPGWLGTARIDTHGTKMAVVGEGPKLQGLDNGPKVHGLKIAQWELGTGEIKPTLVNVHGDIAANLDHVTLSPRLDTFATLIDTYTRVEIYVGDMETGKAKDDLPPIRMKFPVGAVAFNTSGMLLLVHKGPLMAYPFPSERHEWDKVYDLDHGLRDLTGQNPARVSPDGRWLLRLTPTAIQITETDTLQSREFHNPDDTEKWSTRLQFSPDSKTVVATGLVTRQASNPLPAFLVSYFPGLKGGQEVVTARLWDVETGAELMSIDDNCEVVLFSEDCKTLVTQHGSTFRVWSLPPRKPLLLIFAISVVLWLSVVVGVQLWARFVRHGFPLRRSVRIPVNAVVADAAKMAPP